MIVNTLHNVVVDDDDDYDDNNNNNNNINANLSLLYATKCTRSSLQVWTRIGKVHAPTALLYGQRTIVPI
jgi:hypothetical protein